MAHLTLAGRSDDGKRLLLVSDKGVEFTLDNDARLRAALRGDHGRLGQLEIQMDSTLRPRDIQARIRAGESPDAVAQAAQTTVDKIMAFAAPVLAERQHVAERAQRSSIRRKAGDHGARTLGDAVAGHLRSLNVDPATVAWNAWRREDGRWSLSADYSAGKHTGSASFTYDAPGNYVVVENPDAKWLVGDAEGKAPATGKRDDLRHARKRRLSAVPGNELPLGDDAIEMVNAPRPAKESAAPRADELASLGSEQPVEAYLDDDPPTREAPSARDADDLGAESPEDDAPSRRAVKKSRGRASVPSWDEIMFGGGKND